MSTIRNFHNEKNPYLFNLSYQIFTIFHKVGNIVNYFLLQVVHIWLYMFFINTRGKIKGSILSTWSSLESIKTIRNLHKPKSILRKNVKLWLVKQTLWKVLMQLIKVTKYLHYEKTKPKQQHKFDLLYVPCNVYERNIYT